MISSSRNRNLFYLAAGLFLVLGLGLCWLRGTHRGLGPVTYDWIDITFSLYLLVFGMTFERARGIYREHQRKALSDQLHERRYGNRWTREDLLEAISARYPSSALVQRVSVRYGDSKVESAFFSLLVPKEIRCVGYEKGQCEDVPKPTRQGARYLALYRKAGRQYTDEVNLRLMDWSIQGGDLHLTFGPTTFLGYLRSTGFLDMEFFDALGGARSRRTPLRNACMTDTAGLLDVKGRLCLGGVNVALALNTKDGYIVLLQVRSAAVADSRGEVSVVPKGFHQPFNPDFPYLSLDLKNSIYRELAEECFGHDLKQNETFLDPEAYLQNCPGVKEILKSLEEGDGRCTLHLTRFGLNAVTGNYALNALLAVHDPKFYLDHIQHIQHNFEADTFLQCRVGDPVQVRHLLAESRWNDDSIVAFSDALVVLRDHFQAPVDPGLKVVLEG